MIYYIPVSEHLMSTNFTNKRTGNILWVLIFALPTYPRYLFHVFIYTY